MSNQKNKVYQSFIRKPKILGLSVPLFGLEFVTVLLLFIWFGFSLVSWMVVLVWIVAIHSLLKKMEEKDPHFITLWITNILLSQNHYRPTARIDKNPKRVPKSIPKMK